uniref:RBP-1 protein n=1 Tax=Globodera pallida TaxID=36090 RepID=H6BHB9_GLOPA|nr:RBP-1 protein [Globodera pallida]AFA26016.1 RBP-1 protein [Globodera pallida]
MRTFLFSGVVFFLVASILLETDASPKPNKKVVKGSSGSGNAEPNAGLTLQNQWNPKACDPFLTLSETERRLMIVEYPKADWACDPFLTLSETERLMIAEHTKADWGCRSVLAVESIPNKESGISYYEMQISAITASVSIGLATKEMPLDKWVGYVKGTYSYDSRGYFWGHEVAGCSHLNKHPFIKVPKFGEGDVVGCGVNLEKRQIFYTLNGELLEPAGLPIDHDADLFPCITVYAPGTKIEANFGPEFHPKSADVIEKLKNENL